MLMTGGVLVGASFMLVATTSSLWQWFPGLSTAQPCENSTGADRLYISGASRQFVEKFDYAHRSASAIA